MDLVRALAARLTWRLVLYWGALLGGFWLFVSLVDEFYEEGGFFFDEPVLAWFYGIMGPWLTALALGLSAFGSLPFMTLLSLAVALWLWRAHRSEAVFFASSMGGAAVLMLIAKLVIARGRPELFPDVQLWHAAAPSFPSGHASGSVAFFLTLYLTARRRFPRHKATLAVIGAVLALGVSASRLYLQVHYPSDILAGWALAAAWVLGADGIYRSLRTERSGRFVLLRLPGELVEGYRDLAARESCSYDEAAALALRAGLDRLSGEGAPGGWGRPPVAPRQEPVAPRQESEARATARRTAD